MTSGEISETDEEAEEYVEEVVVPAGWSIEHVLFAKFVKHNKELQKQLSAMRKWWGGRKKLEWHAIEDYLLQTMNWDVSHCYFLAKELDAKGLRKDDGNLRDMVGSYDFFQVFKAAVADSGRNPSKWRAFDQRV